MVNFVLLSILFLASDSSRIQIGEEAPIFSLPNMQNEYVALRDLCGKKLRKPWKNKTKHVVVISFFATWCKPCIAEIPHLQKVREKFKDKPVKFFLVNVGEDRQKIQSFLKTKDIQIPILMDKYKKISEKYDALTLPRLFIVDKNGIIQLEKKGFKDGARFEQDLNSLIAKLLNS